MKVCPEFVFEPCDIFETDLLTVFDYNTVVCFDFLDHVATDTRVLSGLRPGARFLGTVSNFPAVGHALYFIGEKNVIKRYQPFFSHLRVDFFRMDDHAKGIFLIDGVIINC